MKNQLTYKGRRCGPSWQAQAQPQLKLTVPHHEGSMRERNRFQ